MIRQIEERDIPALVELGALMHAESSFADVPFDGREAFALASRCIEKENWFCAVAERNGAPVGMFVGNDAPFYFSQARGGFDKLWYVTPTWRGSSAGIRLLNSFLDWCRLRDLRFVRIGINTGVGTDQTGHMLQRLGFTSTGGNYSLKISNQPYKRS
ncbi:MAG: GNAT family N-acetyltransferase [Rhodospirillales bacterium]